MAEEDAHNGGGHRAHHELTFSADVENTGFEGEGHGKAGDYVGDGVDDNIGDILYVAETLKESSVGGAHVQTHYHKENRTHKEAQNNAENGVDKAVFRNDGG